MKQAGLFVPLIVFFGVFLTTGDILAATAAIMAVVTLQVIFERFQKGKVDQKLLITWILLMVFGSATLAFRDPIFIQWKVTIVNWLFALSLLATQLMGKQPIKGLLEMSGAFPELPNKAWKTVTYIWVVAFSFIGLANLYFVFYTDEATWVNFKVFGTLGITIGFTVITAIYLSKFFKKDNLPSENS